jgi:two-component system sensor histidine kinase AtoS
MSAAVGVGTSTVALCESEAESGTVKAYLRIVCDALDLTADGVLITDLEGRVIYANSVISAMFERGQDQVLGKKASELFAAKEIEGLDGLQGAIQGMRKWADEIVVGGRGGTDLTVEVSAHPVTDDAGNVIGSVALFVDVTGQHKTRERLARYEHLAILGQLTGGVAHELRNALGLIKGAAHFLDASLVNITPEEDKAVAILKSGVEKSDQIVDSLLKVARPAPSSRREVDINEIVRDALADARIPENVDSVTQLDVSLPEIMADAGQLNVILDNLIRNAIQAMPDGGQLKVTTGTRDGKWIVVSVADTGVGIPEADQKKLFEPLFTKRSGGMGLGLALVRSLTEGHGGHVELESEVGKGSAFSVYLPINCDSDCKELGGIR